MRVTARLMYVKREVDGSETILPIPDNYPDMVEVEVDSMEQVGAMVAIAVTTDLKIHGVIPQLGLECLYYEVQRVDDPSRN